MQELKILAIDPGDGTAHNVVLDSIDAFVRLGHNVESVRHESKIEVWEGILEERILAFKPDFIYTVNHIGIISDLLTSRKIFHASWFIDDPFLWWLGKESMKRSISPYCILFVCDRTYIDRLKRVGFENVYYLPFATNPKIFKPIKLTREEIERYNCNVSFAGSSLYNSNFQKWYRWAEDVARRQPKGEIIMDGVIRLKSQNPMLRIWDILNEVQRSLNSSIFFNDENEYGTFLAVLEHRANSLYRKEMIEAAKDFGLYLYGDEGWRDLVNRKVNFFGSLDNRSELPLLYNASRINLNITQSQTPTSPPIRPFDIAACGGFLLSDYRRDLGNLFEIDKEIVCYHNKEDLREKIKYYLAHPEERKEIAMKARARVLRDHTYTKRLRKLIDIIPK